jgi:Domain of unknown function (DUF397)
MTQWRKSSRSNSSGGDCVEVANLTETVLDSRAAPLQAEPDPR